MISLFSTLLISLISLLTSAPEAELVFAGDAMQHERQLKAARQADGTYDYSPYYRAFEPYIKSADFAVINLETTLGGTPYSGYPCFSAPDSYLRPIMDAGFDMVLLANNHMLDKRDKGLKRTVATLRNAGMPFIGAYDNAARRSEVLPFIRDINGFKVAFLNYTYGNNGITIQGDVVVDYIDRAKMSRDIKAAREAGAEIMTVCMHWGDEYKLLPNDTQKRLADFLFNEGVDIIIGGHPHVIQPMELRHSDRHNKNQFLVYSLGNYISAMRKTDCRGGAMVRVKLKRDTAGRAVVDSGSYRLVFVQEPDSKLRNYRLVEPEEAMKGNLAGACREFRRNAMRIFDKYNKNVPIDTMPMSTYDK